MKLIKCSHCGRPFYNEEKACPYCGHATNLSATNFVTRPISDPKAHKLMEDMLSGNLTPEPRPVHAAPLIHDDEPSPAPLAEPAEVEEQQPLPNAGPEPEATVDEAAEPSNAVRERADGIATALQQTEEVSHEEHPIEEPNAADTDHLPRKRRGWIWIVVVILVLAIAAAVYLKWDFVYGKISSLLGK